MSLNVVVALAEDEVGTSLSGGKMKKRVASHLYDASYCHVTVILMYVHCCIFFAYVVEVYRMYVSAHPTSIAARRFIRVRRSISTINC